MNKTFEKVKTFSKDVFHFCCFGSASVPYGFSHAYSRAATTQVNLIEPYFDDVMFPMCDNFNDVKMFVAFFSMSLISFLFACQNPNLFQFAIDTFWGGNAITTEAKKRKEKKQIGASNSTRLRLFSLSICDSIIHQNKVISKVKHKQKYVGLGEQDI